MFDLGWTEMLVVGVVALIVVGPKDLPVMFRNVGRFVGKMRGMAREFSQAMNDAADESGVRDVAKTLKAAANPMGSALDGVKDAARDLTSGLDLSKFDPTKPDATKADPAKADTTKADTTKAGPAKYEPDSETGKLSAERVEQAKKIQADAERRARQAADAAATAKDGEAAPEQDAETST